MGLQHESGRDVKGFVAFPATHATYPQCAPIAFDVLSRQKIVGNVSENLDFFLVLTYSNMPNNVD